MSTQHSIVLDSDIACARVAKLAKYDWPEWLKQGKCKIEIIIRPYIAHRTVDQNSRVWLMLGLLESNGVVCEALGRRMSSGAWHDYLRIKHGFISGTRLVPIPSGDGYQLIEAPAPQPTHKGGKGQMSKADHSSYMERIHDELHDAGINFDEAAA